MNDDNIAERMRRLEFNAKAMARAADTEKAEAKFWRERARELYETLSTLWGGCDHEQWDTDFQLEVNAILKKKAP